MREKCEYMSQGRCVNASVGKERMFGSMMIHDQNTIC